MERSRPYRIAAGLSVAAAALIVAVGIAASRVGSLQGSGVDRSSFDGMVAPDFQGIDGWLNSNPLSIEDLRGHVLLVDFWTYSCINCIRTFPHLRALHERYEPAGLRIVGVHSPEFDFERESSNVAEAVARHAIPYPVALDNAMDTWRAYRNLYWPHVYLIDAEGTIRYDHIGEGGEEEIQDTIRTLLAEAGKPLPEPIDFGSEPPTLHITPEVYAGVERGLTGGYLGNPEGYAAGVTEYAPVDAATIEAAGTAGVFFLDGRWEGRPEFVEAAEDGARVVLPYYARDVFFVADGPARAAVRVDGTPPGDGLAGADVRAGVIRVDRADLFRAVEGEEPSRGVLVLEVTEGFRLFSFTFG